jgi:hypothetical protein
MCPFFAFYEDSRFGGLSGLDNLDPLNFVFAF